MISMLHVATGAIHEVLSSDGYPLPDWQQLPTRPAGPAEQWTWSESAWVKNNALGLQIIRDARDALLEQTDKFMVPDRPLSTEQRAAWVTYRQALRDLPETTVDPFNPEWPTPPSTL